jgi:hypothetical protein
MVGILDSRDETEVWGVDVSLMAREKLADAHVRLSSKTFGNWVVPQIEVDSSS